MNEITGSTKETQKALDRTNEIVTGTGYMLDTAAQSVQNFVTRGATVDDATDRIEAWGDAVAFYGKGSDEEFQNVTDALAKMQTKGTVGMDQLNRLFDVGIDAVGMYAEATGKSASDVQDDLSSGEISAEKFIDTVTVAMMEGTNGVTNIAGAAKEAGASWGATFGNMRTAVSRGVANIITKIDEMLSDSGLPDMRTMIANFGNAFEKTLNKVAEAIPVIVGRLKEFASWVKGVYEAIKPWLPLFGAVSAGLLTAYTAFKTFEKAKTFILSAQLAFKALNSTMLANPIFWIATAIVAAATLIYVYWEPISEFFINIWGIIKDTGLAIWDALKEVWSSTIDFFKELWGTITEFFSEIWTGIAEVAMLVWDVITEKWIMVVEFLKELFTPVIEFFTELFMSVQLTIMEVWEMITEALSVVWENIKTIASAAWELIKNIILGPILLLINLVTGSFEEFKSNLSAIWDNIKSAATSIWNAITNTIKTIITSFINIVKSVLNGLKTTISAIWNAMKSTAKSIWNGLKTVVTSIVNGIKNTITNIWNGIKNTVSNIVTGIKNTVTNIFNSMKNAISNAMSAIKTTVQNLWNGVMSFFKGISLVDIGKNIIKGFTKGISSMFDGVKKTISKITNFIPGFIKKALGIKSPSRVLMGLGEDTGEGLEVGMGASLRGISKMADKLVSAAVPDIPMIDMDVGGQVASINSQANRQLQMQSHLTSELNVSRQPIEINIYDDKEGVRAYVNETNATEATVRRFDEWM